LYYQVSTAGVILEEQTPLTVTQSLVRALLDDINGRFGTVFDDTKAQLASAVHPKFKLDWVDNQFQKALLGEQMKRAVEAEQRRNVAQQDATISLERESHQDQATAATPTAKNFFACIASRRNATVARPDADAEVDAYLSDRSTVYRPVIIRSLSKYPPSLLALEYRPTSQCSSRASVLPRWTSFLSSLIVFV